MNNKTKKTVAVIGLGYVGLPLALLASKKGYKVYGIDISEEKINLINKKESPFVDDKVSKTLKKSTMEASTDFTLCREADILVICVPTPVYDNHMPNLEPVEGACRGIAPFIKRGQLVILESTVNPGVSEDVVLPILEKESGLKAGEDFYLAHCPERINPGDKKWDVENISRVVGSLEKNGLRIAVAFYKSLITGEVKPMGSLKEAEAVKVVENSFRDINIAFVNELAMSFSKLGIDVVSVIKGSSSKPFAFMPHYPGCGVGGHCIPVDPYYLIEYAKVKDFDHDFLSLARRINNHMPKFTVDQAVRGLNEKKIPVKGTKVALLGLAYKAEIDDCRESPAFKIKKLLEGYGAKVETFDPFVPEESSARSFDEALKGSKAAVIATGHKLFREMKPSLLLKHKVEVLIDGRNCLPKEDFIKSGLIYKGIGR
ncbi:nucleotide sugar dehydrogenase [Candidatus Parcubacteria bacterium]|nr:MAG: nucleotide sugar dehydrogenase [Candidatus Parcubacteria bacterium]